MSTQASSQQPETAGRLLRVAWSRTDSMRLITVVGFLGLAAAAAMAVFGLPPVDLHGPQHYYGIMSPTCGATRAARLTAQGDLVGAWRYNPMGIVAAVAALVASARLLVGVTTRRWLEVQIAWTRRRVWIAVAVAVALGVLLEIRQQGRAELLMLPY